MSIKEELHQAVDELPEDCSRDNALYQLYVQLEIQAGSEDVRRGDVVSDEEARQRFAKWLTD